MLKKIKMIILSSLVMIGSIVAISPTNAVEASMSGWQTISGSCKVRVWTDADTYTSRATSVDTYAETNGKCNTLNYKMYISAYAAGGSGQISPTKSGSFKTKTPTKKFYFSQMDNVQRPMTCEVNVEFSNGKFASKTFTLK